MKPTGVLMEVERLAVDLTEISWQCVAPCGCTWGVISASIGDEHLTTPAQVSREYWDSARERRAKEAQGFTFRPNERKAACDEMRKPCTHQTARDGAKS